ncbi:hypothetical protein CYMTET_28570 [Cymbomonas tetramitiformis]|uniref:Uncharacterized protein n=1 Tax=Cymbomonas tetramitiformis TaxID=36881 RepID=A0AAE0KW33_9CHLO|nr:hypothetical protein CYMTET_28570 [Cymbomonas tetramitiformis]
MMADAIQEYRRNARTEDADQGEVRETTGEDWQQGPQERQGNANEGNGNEGTAVSASTDISQEEGAEKTKRKKLRIQRAGQPPGKPEVDMFRIFKTQADELETRREQEIQSHDEEHRKRKQSPEQKNTRTTHTKLPGGSTIRAATGGQPTKQPRRQTATDKEGEHLQEGKPGEKTDKRKDPRPGKVGTMHAQTDGNIRERNGERRAVRNKTGKLEHKRADQGLRLWRNSDNGKAQAFDVTILTEVENAWRTIRMQTHSSW